MRLEEVKKEESTELGYGPIAAALGTIGIYFFGQILGYFLFLFLFSLYATVAVEIDAGNSQLDLGGMFVALKNSFNTYFDLTRIFKLSPEALFFQFVCVQTITLGLLFWFLRSRKVVAAQIGLVKPKLRDLGYALLGAGVYIAAYIGIVSVLASIFRSLDLEQKQDLGFSADITGTGLVFVFISLVILPPIVEELIARGFLYTGLRRGLKFLPAAIITSLLFGIAHLPGGEGGATIWIAFVDTFILSMVLVYLREKTGSLWAPIGLHALKNLVAFLALFVFKIS